MTDDYEVFVAKLEGKYPEMFAGQYGGVCINKGWWPILEALCSRITGHLKYRNNLSKQYPDQH